VHNILPNVLVCSFKGKYMRLRIGPLYEAIVLE